MKIFKILTLIILLFLCPVFIFAQNSFLNFTILHTLEEGECAANVRYKRLEAESTDDEGNSGPQKISYISAGKQSPVHIVSWAKTTPSGFAGADLLALAADYEKEHKGWKVLAGINADYYDMSTMIPVNALVQDGDVIKSGNNVKYMSLALADDKSYVVSKQNQVESKYCLAIYDDEGLHVLREFVLDNKNILPGAGKTTFYYGVSPSQSVAGAKMFSVTVQKNMNYGSLFVRGRINKEETEPVTGGDLMLVTRDEALSEQLRQKPYIRIQRHLCNDNAGYKHVIGVGSEPLRGGNILSFTEAGDQSADFAATRNPRSMIGFTAAGGVILAAFDGRQIGAVGVNLREGANIMKYFGCVDAFNLDGGGSTQLIVRGPLGLRYANSPSETYRRVADALFIVAPDIYTKTAYAVESPQNLRFSYEAHYGADVQPGSVRLIVDGRETEHIGSDFNIALDADNTIHYISLEFTYYRDGREYKTVMVSKRVNIADYYFPPPEKVKPYDFTVRFITVENGFEAIINFLDPDNMIIKVYLLYERDREIAIKDARGYVCKFYNIGEQRDFIFRVQFFYVGPAFTPICEEYPEEFIYEYRAPENFEAGGCHWFHGNILLYVLIFVLYRRKTML